MGLIKMDKIDANSKSELLGKLRAIDITVPRRNAGRSTEHTEKSAIATFMISMVNADRFEFPISIIHRDRPDFLLLTANTSVGIECTEAIPEQLAWAQALMAEHFPDGFYEPGFFRWGSPIRTKDEILAILTKSQEELHGEPVYGNGIEKDWANWMNENICHKTEKMNSSGYEIFDRNHLLIYDNLTKPWNDLAKATKLLHGKLKPLWAMDTLHFNRIIIETRNYFVGITPLEIELDEIEKV